MGGGALWCVCGRCHPGHSDVIDAEISLPGYTLFRADRPTDNKGGGVLLYVLSSLNPSAFVPQTKYPEHVWCKPEP